MTRKLILVLVLLALLCCCASAQAYTPGQSLSCYKDAWNAGKMLMLDLNIQADIDPAAMGLSDEEAAQAEAAFDMLDHATLTLGAGKLENGLRVKLGTIYADDEPVSADATADITTDGLSLQSSLIPGEAFSVQWGTILRAAGLPAQDTEMILQLLENFSMDTMPELTATAIEGFSEGFATGLAPYAEVVAQFIATLPTQITENTEADDVYPAAAREIGVAVTQKDLGVLLGQIIDVMQADPLATQTMMETLAQQGTPVASAEEAYAALRESVAELTDTSMPVYIFIGMDADGMPLYLTAHIENDLGETLLFSIIHTPATAETTDTLSLDFCLLDAQGNATDGLSLVADYLFDEADDQVYGFGGDLMFYADSETYLAAELVGVNRLEATSDGAQGYVGQLAFSLDTPQDGVNLTIMNDAEKAPTADGGEKHLMHTTLTVNTEGETISIPVTSEMLMTPGDGAPVTVFTESGAMAFAGVESYVQTVTLRTEDAAPAAATQIALENTDEAALQALLGRLEQNAMALLDALAAQLPSALIGM